MDNFRRGIPGRDLVRSLTTTARRNEESEKRTRRYDKFHINRNEHIYKNCGFRHLIIHKYIDPVSTESGRKQGQGSS